MKPAPLPPYVTANESSLAVVSRVNVKKEQQQEPQEPNVSHDYRYGYQIIVSGKKNKKYILKHTVSKLEVILPTLDGVEWEILECSDGNGETVFDGFEYLLCWKILCDAFPEAAAGMKQGPPTRSSQKAKVPAGIPAAPTLLPGMKKGLLGLGWAVQTFL